MTNTNMILLNLIAIFVLTAVIQLAIKYKDHKRLTGIVIISTCVLLIIGNITNILYELGVIK